MELIKHLVADEQKIKLQIWDTAGHEKFKSLAKAYNRGAHGVFIVFGVTSTYSYEKVTECVNSIVDQNGTDSVDMVLIGNKIDLEREVTKEKGQELADKLGVKYFETSALLDINISDPFLYVTELALKRYRSSKFETTIKLDNESKTLLDEDAKEKCC